MKKICIAVNIFFYAVVVIFLCFRNLHQSLSQLFDHFDQQSMLHANNVRKSSNAHTHTTHAHSPTDTKVYVNAAHNNVVPSRCVLFASRYGISLKSPSSTLTQSTLCTTNSEHDVCEENKIPIVVSQQACCRGRKHKV